MSKLHVRIEGISEWQWTDPEEPRVFAPGEHAFDTETEDPAFVSALWAALCANVGINLYEDGERVKLRADVDGKVLVIGKDICGICLGRSPQDCNCENELARPVATPTGPYDIPEPLEEAETA